MQGDRSKAENKRLARCGTCEGCNAKDCGACVNCLDKPKFQGPGVWRARRPAHPPAPRAIPPSLTPAPRRAPLPGVKKQACVMRRCVQILARGHNGEEKVESPRKKQKVAHLGAGGLEPPGFLLASFDFDEHLEDHNGPFDAEVRAPPQAPPSAVGPPPPNLTGRSLDSPPFAQPDLGALLLPGNLDEACSVKPGRKSGGGSPRGEGRRQAARLQRCGKCIPCKAVDCGTCQNCADKPRFGGKGVKKQACTARRCVSLTKHEAEAAAAAEAMEVMKTTLAPLSDALMRTCSPDNLSAAEAVAAGNGSPTGVIEGPLDLYPLYNEEKVFPEKPFADSAAPSEQPPTWPESWGDLSGPWEEPPREEAEALPACELVTEPALMNADNLEYFAPVDATLRLDDWLSDANSIAVMG